MATFGTTTIGGSTESTGGDGKVICRYQLTEAGTITGIHFYTDGASGNLRGTLWSDNAGAPNALLGSTPASTMTGPKWYDMVLSVPYVAAAAWYWLGATWDSQTNWYYAATSANSYWDYDYDLNKPTQAIAENVISVHANYTPSGGGVTVKKGSSLVKTMTTMLNSKMLYNACNRFPKPKGQSRRFPPFNPRIVT